MQVPEKPTWKSPRKRLFQDAVASTQASPTKVRKVISQDHAYTSDSHKPAETSKEISTLRNEMRILKQKLKRWDLKITNMEHLLKTLKEKQLVSDENHRLLDHNFGGTMAQEIFRNQVKNTAATSKNAMRYTNELKSFAVTLHYYSLKAYDFIRKILALPDPANIRAWGSSVQCEPGFLIEIMHLVGENATKQPNMKDIALIVDGMALRKGIVWNPKTKRYVGTVDYGIASPEVEDDLATEALAFLIVGLKTHFKQPVAYFLQNKCSAAIQAELIRDCISLLHDEGLCVN